MARDLIIVGAGTYWSALVSPSLAALKASGLINTVTTIDTSEHTSSADTTHVVRKPSVPLSQVIDGLEKKEPFVILSHVNQLHTPEAIELMTNSQSNPKLLIEKPYAIDAAQQKDLAALLERHKGNIGLLEYYLTMKGVPLLIPADIVRHNSFYYENNGIIKVLQPNMTLESFTGKLAQTIGKPLYIVSDVLEGEGAYGTIEHRNLSIVDKRDGGGMIQDLGHHAITPIMALEPLVGKLTSQSIKDIRVAYCDQYMQSAMTRGLSAEHIAESYAEMDLTTSTGVPVHVSLGKYIQNVNGKGQNQRRITIVGTRGTALYDMTENILALQHDDKNHDVIPLLLAEKKNPPKYLAVLRAGMEYLEGRNPFTFNPVEIAMNAQQIVLDAVAKNPSMTKFYTQGKMHDTIFG